MKAALMTLCILAAASTAIAHDVQVVPGPSTLLVTTQAGGEHWSLAFDFDTGNLHGSVLGSDGGTTFIACVLRDITESPTHPHLAAFDVYHYRCFVAAPCNAKRGCAGSPMDWTPIADPVDVSGSFFLP